MGKKGSKKNIPPTKPQAKEEKREATRKWYFFLAVIGVITLFSYFNSLNNQFVFDDIHLISKNPSIRGIEKIPHLLGIGKRRVSYRPMRMISYAVDYTLNKRLWRHFGRYERDDEGLKPLGYHISNLTYHIVTSFLVFLVIYRLVGNYRVAFLAASLFVLHPVHTESVTYLSGRRDILFTLFYLAGFYFFLCYRKARKSTFIIVSFLAYLLSLGSKEMAVTLPAIFLCYDLVENYTVKVGKINLNYFFYTIKKVILQSKYLYSLLFIGTLPYSYYKVFIKSPSHQITYYGDSMLTTFLTVGKILVYYMRLLVYPIKLNADYSYNAFPLSSSFFEPATFFSFIVLGVIGYAVLRLLADHKMLAFGVIWFFITLLPVCQIFPHHELLTEHYLYLPSFGLCLISALLLNSFLKGERHVYLIYASFIAVVLLFSFRIVDRNNDWRDGFTLWEKTVKTAPKCTRAHNNLGYAYDGKGRLDDAIAEYKRALVINPNYAMAHNNLGYAYDGKGRLDDAISEFKKALTINPNLAGVHTNLGLVYAKKGRLDDAISEHKKALAIKRNYAEAHYNLGVAYDMMDRLDDAISGYKKALAINPDYAEAHNNLGNAYDKMDMLDDAIAEYKRALVINPNYAKAHYNLGIACAKKGRLDDAIAEYKRALVINPNYAKAHYNLGNAYLKKGEIDKSILEYKQAIVIKPDYAEAHYNLGITYAKKGRLDEAISEYRKALTINPNQAKAHNSLAIAHFKKRQYQLAIKHCDKAIGLRYKVNTKLLRGLLPYR